MMRLVIATLLTMTAAGAMATPKSAAWPDCDTGAPAQQIESCGKIIAKGGEAPADLAWVFYRRGNGFEDTGEVAKARADYEQAIKLNPQFSEPHNALGILYFNAKEYEKTLQAYDRALAIAPKNWRALNNRGNALLALKRFDQAIAAYDAAIAINENVPAAFVNRGVAHQSKRNFDKALADFARAIQLDRNYAEAYWARGSAYVDMLQPDRAVQDAGEFIRQRPSDVRGYQLRAAAKALKRDLAGVKGDIGKAIELNPQDADNYLVRGNANALLGDDKSAAADYDAALKLNPDAAAVLGSRGALRFRGQQYDLAIADLERAVALDPGSAWFRSTLDEARAAKAALAKRQTPVAGPPKLERRVALIIGNSRYTGISPLKNASRDAAAVAAALKAKGYTIFGYPKTDMTRAQMFDAIKAFEAAAANADTSVVWYAGHGQEFDTGGGQSGNWLIPVDFSANGDIAEGAVPLSRLITAASPARSLRVVIVDACRNNNLPSAQRGARGFRVEERSDMLIVFSTRAGRLAEDGEGQNSPFATAFLKELDQSAKLDVRQFFGGVAERMEAASAGGQEPERIDRMKSRATLALAP